MARKLFIAVCWPEHKQFNSITTKISTKSCSPPLTWTRLEYTLYVQSCKQKNKSTFSIHLALFNVCCDSHLSKSNFTSAINKQHILLLLYTSRETRFKLSKGAAFLETFENIFRSQNFWQPSHLLLVKYNKSHKRNSGHFDLRFFLIYQKPLSPVAVNQLKTFQIVLTMATCKMLTSPWTLYISNEMSMTNSLFLFLVSVLLNETKFYWDKSTEIKSGELLKNK